MADRSDATRLDELELALRRLPGVVAVGFVDADALLLVEVQVGPEGYDEIARDAALLAGQHAPGPVTVEVVRWGGGGPAVTSPRITLVDVTTDPSAGQLTVELALGEETATGRASSKHGLLAAVQATVHALRVLVPGLPYLPGWARTIETTPERRFLVVASVTDPDTQSHRRGVAEGGSPLEAAARATLAALNRTIEPGLG